MPARVPAQVPLALTCRAVINRYGFNNDGLDAVAERLASFRQRCAAEPWRCPGLVAVNLGAPAKTLPPSVTLTRIIYSTATWTQPLHASSTGNPVVFHPTSN